MSGPGAVVGIDLGTTCTKVLIQDVTGRPLSLLETRTPWSTTATGGTQITIEALAGVVIDLMSSALIQAEATSEPVRILGIGVSGFAESGVLIDGSGRPCTPVIAWFDRRGEQQVARISQRRDGFGRDFVRHTGLPWDNQASAAKLCWFADHGLALTAAHRWLSVPEYLVHLFGGEQVSEPSLASRTGLLDQDTGRVWGPGATELGLPASLLPEPLPAGRPAGKVRFGGLSRQFQDAVLTVAGHDHPVAAIGAGATGTDELFNSTGTADVIARSLPGRLSGSQREQLVGHGISVGAHLLPDTGLLLGGVRGGLLLRRTL